MIKRELIEFLNELVELASEENRARAVLVKDRLIKPLVLLQDGDEESLLIKSQVFFEENFKNPI